MYWKIIFSFSIIVILFVQRTYTQDSEDSSADKAAADNSENQEGLVTLKSASDQETQAPSESHQDTNPVGEAPSESDQDTNPLGEDRAEGKGANVAETENTNQFGEPPERHQVGGAVSTDTGNDNEASAENANKSQDASQAEDEGANNAETENLNQSGEPPERHQVGGEVSTDTGNDNEASAENANKSQDVSQAEDEGANNAETENSNQSGEPPERHQVGGEVSTDTENDNEASAENANKSQDASQAEDEGANNAETENSNQSGEPPEPPQVDAEAATDTGNYSEASAENANKSQDASQAEDEGANNAETENSNQSVEPPQSPQADVEAATDTENDIETSAENANKLQDGSREVSSQDATDSGAESTGENGNVSSEDEVNSEAPNMESSGDEGSSGDEEVSHEAESNDGGPVVEGDISPNGGVGNETINAESGEEERLPESETNGEVTTGNAEVGNGSESKSEVSNGDGQDVSLGPEAQNENASNDEVSSGERQVSLNPDVNTEASSDEGAPNGNESISEASSGEGQMSLSPEDSGEISSDDGVLNETLSSSDVSSGEGGVSLGPYANTEVSSDEVVPNENESTNELPSGELQVSFSPEVNSEVSSDDEHEPSENESYSVPSISQLSLSPELNTQISSDGEESSNGNQNDNGVSSDGEASSPDSEANSEVSGGYEIVTFNKSRKKPLTGETGSSEDNGEDFDLDTGGMVVTGALNKHTGQVQEWNHMTAPIGEEESSENEYTTPSDIIDWQNKTAIMGNGDSSENEYTTLSDIIDWKNATAPMPEEGSSESAYTTLSHSSSVSNNEVNSEDLETEPESGDTESYTSHRYPHKSTEKPLFGDEDVLGVDTARIAFTFRENLINLFGYLMYQIAVDTEPEVYFYLHEFKSALEANTVDVFKLIDVIPELDVDKLNDQLIKLLQRIEEVCDKKYCQVKCTAKMWISSFSDVDFEKAVSHLGYNPLLHQIIETPEDMEKIKIIVDRLQRTPMYEIYYFSPHIARILNEVIEKRTTLEEGLVGYLLPFFPWPADNSDVVMAMNILIHTLIDEKNLKLITCGVRIPKELAGVPIEMLKKLLSNLANSKCNRIERTSAQFLLQISESQLAVPDYRNYFTGYYVEINRLWDLLNIVTHEDYPPEIVLARDRIRRYVDKVIFFIAYPTFIAYKYKIVEEMLYAFLEFLLQETPYPPFEIKMSINALKSHLMFYIGPRKINYNLLVSIVDGFLAPDMNEYLIEQFLAIKAFVLDESVSITKILQGSPSRKCTHLVSCYFEIFGILKDEPMFEDKVKHLLMPDCILRRFMNKQDLPDNYKGSGMEGISVASLLEIIDYNQFLRETVLSAQQIKEHIQKTQEGLTIRSDRLYCTKHETLLDSLENLMMNNVKYPPDIIACMKAVIPALRFKLTPISNIDSTVMRMIASAWRSPFTDEITAAEMTRVEAIIQANEKDLDEKLYNMNTQSCVDMLECYNAIAKYLNYIDLTLDFKYRAETSPELYALSIGDVDSMSTKGVIDIVNSVQTHQEDDSELEAAKSYILDFDLDLDSALKDVNCAGQQVKPCFLLILQKLRFDKSMSHVEINIAQYLLMPTTCDKRHCWWYPYEEYGSTVINPLQSYLIYLLGYYSVSDVKSLHLQMDIDQIILYLNVGDVEETLSQFKIKTVSNNMEKIEKFLLLLMRASLVEDSVIQSVNNVYLYITKNTLPEKLNIGNLDYLKKLFKTETTNKTVIVELDEIGNEIIKMENDIADILDNVFVNCFTLETCLLVIKRQLSTPAYFSKPASKIILQLLSPYSCMGNKKVCRWLGLEPDVVIPEVVLPPINQEINRPNISVVEKIAWKIIKQKIIDNPDVIISIIAIQGDKPLTLEEITNQLLDNPNTPKEIREIIASIIKNDKKDLMVDSDVLGNLLEEIYEHTHDEAIKTQIKDIIEIVENNKATVDHIFNELSISCEIISDCVENVFDYIVARGYCDKPIPKELIELFHAKQCSKAECPWKKPPDIKKTILYKNRLLQYLMSVMNDEATPFHIELDILDVIEYLDGADISEDIYNEVLCSKDPSDKSLINVLSIINQAENTPHQVATSVKNILNFIESGQPPSFLQVSNLIQIIHMLTEQATEITVKQILENGLVFVKKFQDDVTHVLEVSPVDCATLQSCVDTLLVEMEKRKDEKIPEIIVSLLRPDICRPKTCPWVAQSFELKLKEMEEVLLKELKKIQKDKSVPVHIKLDAQAFKKVIKKCLESMTKLPDETIGKPEALLMVFLKTLDYDIISKLEVQYIKKDLEDYLSKGTMPEFMDVAVLLIFGELLKRITKNDIVKMEIEKKRAVIKRDVTAIKNLMSTCRVNCPNVRKCAETMEICLNLSPTKDDPHSVTVIKMIHPKKCTRTICPWLPPESREDLLNKLNDIKSEVKAKIDNEEVAIIIRIMLKEFLDMLVIEKIERYLRGISKYDTEKLLHLLKYMRKDKNVLAPNSLRIIQKIYLYLKAGKVPRWLVSGDIPGLVNWLIDLSQQPDIKAYMEAGLNVIMKKKSDVDRELKICAVKCVNLKECLAFLHECLKKSDSIAALWLLQLLFPEPCNEYICPWMPEDLGPFYTEELPIPKPHTIYPDYVIIFYMDFNVLKHIILDFTNSRTLIMIEAFTFLAESSLRRATVINAKGSHKKYMIDYEYSKGFQRVGIDGEPQMDFSTMQSIIICVRYKNGNIRPLKFDLSNEGVREALKDIASRQKTHEQKPWVSIIDVDRSIQKLTLDVLDANTLRGILEQTIDNIMPYDYVAVFFWPRKQMNEPWRSAVITDKSPLEVYLRNLPGMDMANKETPVVLTSDGIITMDFDVNSATVVEGIEAATNGEVPTLYLSRQKKYMFYIPFPFQRNMIPFPLDLSDRYILEVLKESNEKFPLEADDITIYIKDLDDDADSPIALKFDFYGDVIFYLIHNLNNKLPSTTENNTSTFPSGDASGGANMVIIPINDGSDIMVLDLNNEQVRKVLIDQFAEKPQSKRAIVINVPIAGGLIPITLDPQDSVVIQVLQSLMDATITAFNPLSVYTVARENIILLTTLNNNYKIAPVIITDSLSNKKVLEGMQLESGDIPFEIPFGSGTVTIPKDRLFEILQELPKVYLIGPTYTQDSNVLDDEVQIPIESEGKYYYITLETNKNEVMEFLEQSAVSSDRIGVTFIIKDRSLNLKQITLPTDKKDIVTKMIDISARVEIQPRRDTVLAIMAPDKDNMGETRSCILDLSNANVYTAVQDIAMEVNAKSTTKGIYHYVDTEGDLAPIVLDYKNYNFVKFNELEQETPLELKPIRLPSLEGSIPQIGFMVKDHTGRKASLVLNPADPIVWESLIALSAKPNPRHVPVLVNGPDNRQTLFYIDKTDETLVDKLIELAGRSSPFNVPAKPIPLDGRSLVATDMSENKNIVDTRDPKAFAGLIETHKGLPMTEPLMMVLQPDGSGFQLRVDTRVYQYGKKIAMPNPKADTFLVVKPEGQKAVVVDVSSALVSSKLLEMAAPADQMNAEMIVFTDSGGQVQFIRLDTKNNTIIKELWKLQQQTTPKLLAPFVIVPKYAKPYYVFTVTDERGNNEAVILDVTNAKIKTKLISMWDASTKGVPFRIRDSNGNPLTIYFDLSKNEISKKMLSLMSETEGFYTPIVSGGLMEKNRILKIPLAEGTKRFLVNCNVSSPVVIDRLLRLPGRNIIDPKGAAFMLKDLTGHLTTMYLDLNCELVVRALKQVCPHKTILLDPSKTLVLDMKNQAGEHQTQVINLDSESVVRYLTQRGKITQNSRKASTNVEFPLVDFSGKTKIINLDTKDSESMQLLNILSELSLGRNNFESFVIPDGGGTSDNMILFGNKGPILVNQGNEELLDSILSLSMPNNPKATKICFTTASGQIKYGYFDINDSELMMEIKKLTDQYFKKPQFIPPLVVPQEQVIKVPCQSKHQRHILIYLDTTDSRVIEKFKEQSTLSSQSGKYSMKVSLMKNGGAVDVYHLDTANTQTCEQLKLVAFYQCYSPTDGSLLILNVPNKNMPVIILDIGNPRVFAELVSISKKVDHKIATHIAICKGPEGKFETIRLNMKMKTIVNKLMQLVEYTPCPTMPFATASPYGRSPFIAFTAETSNGEVKHILLNPDNPKVAASLDQLATDSAVPKQPLEIIFEDAAHKQKSFVFDASDDVVIQKLYDLTVAKHGLVDALVSIPQKNAFMPMKMVVPTENPDGTAYNYEIEVRDTIRMQEYLKKSRKIPKKAPAVVLYFKDKNDYTVAVRARQSEIFGQGAKQFTPTLKLDKKYIVALTIREKGYKVRPCILNTMDKEVVEALVNITEFTPPEQPFSAGTIVTKQEELIPIRLDLNDKTTQDNLKYLQSKTPAPMAPVLLSSPFGTQPLVVMTLRGVGGNIIPILLDMNNPQTVRGLTELREPRGEPQIRIALSSTVVLNIDLNDADFLRDLIKIANYPALMPAQLTSHITPILMIPIFRDDKMINVYLNTTDEYSSQYLIDFVKDIRINPNEPSQNGVSFYIDDGRGSQNLIVLDTSQQDISDFLLTLGKRMVQPTLLRIKPPTGPQDLVITSVPTSNGYVPVTIDCNNPRVIALLIKLSEPVKQTEDATMLIVNPINGPPIEIVIDRDRPDLREKLDEITMLSPIIVNPIKVLPPNGKTPLLNALVPNDEGYTCFTIDFNDKRTTDLLSDFSKPDDADVTSIEFMTPDGTKDILNLNFSNPEVIRAVKDLQHSVYLKPRPNEYPIITVKDGDEGFDINCNDETILRKLIELSDGKLEKSKLTEIELKDEGGLPITVFIDLDNPTVKSTLKDIVPEIDLPIVFIPSSSVNVSPVRIVPPHSKFPLLMADFPKIGPITLDVNDEKVCAQLNKIPNSADDIPIKVHDDHGNVKLFSLNPYDRRVQSLLKKIPSHKVFAFRPEEKLLPTLIIKGRPLQMFDLTIPSEIEKLKSFSKKSPSAYKIQIPLPVNDVILYIEPEDVNQNVNIPTQADAVTFKWPSTTSYPPVIESEPDDWTDLGSGPSTFKVLEHNRTTPFFTKASTITFPKYPTTPRWAKQTVQSLTASDVTNSTEGYDDDNEQESNDDFKPTPPTNPTSTIYWLSLNMTNKLNNEMRMYTFDLSKKNVLNKLIEYSQSLPVNERIQSAQVKLPYDSFVLNINPYDWKTFKLFERLTTISTGKPSLLVGIQKPQLWWNFTVTDQYQRPMKVELDVANKDILKKIVQLSHMYKANKGSKGTIIKGALPDGKTVELIADLSSTTTIQNLHAMMDESKGGVARPLKSLPQEIRGPKKELIAFTINPPGLKQPLRIVLDVADKNIIRRLKELNEISDGNVDLPLDTGKEVLNIKINPSDKATIKELVDMTVKSTGDNSILLSLENIKDKQRYMPMLTTIEINDAKETVSVSLDVSDKEVLQILKKVEAEDTRLATFINVTDANGVNHQFHININDRQVLSILTALSIPTIAPKNAPRIKLLTFILLRRDSYYTAVQMDLADKNTVLYFVHLVQKYQDKFQSKNFLEVRDDNGQYIPIAVDFSETGFIDELTAVAYTSRRHQIDLKVNTFIVICTPNYNERTYTVFKTKLNPTVVDRLKELPASKYAVTISVVDETNTFRLDPTDQTFIDHLVGIPGVGIMQPSKVKPMLVIYVRENKAATAIYLDLTDTRTMSKLIEMHNSYVKLEASQPLTIIRYLSKGGTRHLFLYISSQIALRQLSKLTVHVAHHKFMKQKLERPVKVYIPQGYGQKQMIVLNLADPLVVEELKLLSIKGQRDKKSIKMVFTDAFGETFPVYMNFYDKVVVSKLIRLSIK